jgi:hypothetical protein
MMFANPDGMERHPAPAFRVSHDTRLDIHGGTYAEEFAARQCNVCTFVAAYVVSGRIGCTD